MNERRRMFQSRAIKLLFEDWMSCNSEAVMSGSFNRTFSPDTGDFKVSLDYCGRAGERERRVSDEGDQDG